MSVSDAESLGAQDRIPHGPTEEATSLKTVGICPLHADEFYMPDAKPGDHCPVMSCSALLDVYEPRRAVCQELASAAREQFGDEQPFADYTAWIERFGASPGGE